MAYNRRPTRRVKKCKLCSMKVEYIDYKNVDLLKDYINEKGKIIPKRLNGNCSKHQRMVKTAIKRARQMALLPFVSE
jgi:small subunit ribosomal protein S18